MTHHTTKLREIKEPDLSIGQTYPFIKDTPEDPQKAVEGKRLEVFITVGGSPFPKVSWKKGQWLQLDDGGRFNVTCDQETGKCMLAIKSVRTADMGKYRVLATNDFGEMSYHFTVSVTKVAGPANPDFKGKLKSRKAKAVKVNMTPEEKEKEILGLLKKSNPKHYEKICLDHGFFDFRMILKKLKEMNGVETVEKVEEKVRVMKKLRHVAVHDEGTAVFETHLEGVTPGMNLKWHHNGVPID